MLAQGFGGFGASFAVAKKILRGEVDSQARERISERKGSLDR
jgi:hypothetical protein